MKRVWLYADPAWGEKGCYKAVISIGYDGNRFYVIHVWIRQTENTKFFRYYYDAYQELDRIYRVKARAACETTYGQARILADFDRWATDNHLPPISHRIKRIDNKDNKNLRIERTETIIETAKILFPEGQDTPTLTVSSSPILMDISMAVMLLPDAWNASRNTISAGTESKSGGSVSDELL
jgi:hypothetical protein